MTWDEERLNDILQQDDPTDIFKGMIELVSGVRAEAIGWTWAQACQQHDQGRDPRRQEVPELLLKANADLNPERE